MSLVLGAVVAGGTTDWLGGITFLLMYQWGLLDCFDND